MTLQARFARECPGVFYLDPQDLDGITAYLQSRDWLEPQESLSSAELAGQGNMNCTSRIRSSRRTFIMKQARPWVAKYPSIAGPPSSAAPSRQTFILGSLQTLSSARSFHACSPQTRPRES